MWSTRPSVPSAWDQATIHRKPGGNARGHGLHDPGGLQATGSSVWTSPAFVPGITNFFPTSWGVMEIFQSQIPGGMISKHGKPAQAAGGRRQNEGGPRRSSPSAGSGGLSSPATPSSQIVGSQAVFNVMMGPYKVLTGEFARPDAGLLRRDHRPPRSGSDETGRKEKAKKPLITQRPADLLKPEWNDLREAALALPGCQSCDEDVLTYAMFPQVAPTFFLHRKEGPEKRGQRPHQEQRRRRIPFAGPGQIRGHLRGKPMTPPPVSPPSKEKIMTNMEQRVEELRKKRHQVELGGGAERQEKHRAQGKLTARERVEQLVDPGSFQETGAFAQHRATLFGMNGKDMPSARGVITGAASVEGRLIHLASQDFTVAGGSAGEVHRGQDYQHHAAGP